MGAVISLVRVMPEGTEVDIDELKGKVEEKITHGEFKTEIKEIAFGLKALEVTIKVSDEEGIDTIMEEMEKVEGVSSVEVLKTGNVMS